MNQSSASVTFRAATNADVEPVRNLIFSILREYGLTPEPQGTDADIADIEANYLAPGGVFECIEDEAGNLLGTFGLFRLSETEVELRKMYLAPSARGKGLGRRALTRATERARDLGYRTLSLETASVLKEAIALYEKFGFRRVAHAPCVARCDQGYTLDLVENGD
jgi:GNAT superfamily N-acetyltransferase